MTENSFVIIKPDAIRRGLIGEIIARFERKCLTIRHIERRWKSESWALKHYADVPPQVLPALIEFMTNTPLIGIDLHGSNAIAVIRKMVGVTNSANAAPGTIRGDFGTWPIYVNCVHASDSPTAYEHESSLFFDDSTDYIGVS